MTDEELLDQEIERLRQLISDDAEKDRVWQDIQRDAVAGQSAGKLDSVEELIRAYRARNKST